MRRRRRRRHRHPRGGGDPVSSRLSRRKTLGPRLRGDDDPHGSSPRGTTKLEMAKSNSATSARATATLEVIHGVERRPCATASSSSSSARRAAASRRCCAWSPASRRSPAGEIAIGERVVNTLEPKDRDIAMVFQNYALYPHMSVFDNMAYGLKIRGFAKADIGERVEARGRHPRARAAARAQAAPALRRPAPARRDGPRDRARARGVPVRRAAVQPRREAARADALRDPEAAPAAEDDELYVTHDQVEAMTLAHRMIVMNAGRAEQIGTPMEVYENPQTQFVAGFIGSPAMNFLPATVEGGGQHRARARRHGAHERSGGRGGGTRRHRRDSSRAPASASDAGAVGDRGAGRNGRAARRRHAGPRCARRRSPCSRGCRMARSRRSGRDAALRRRSRRAIFLFDPTRGRAAAMTDRRSSHRGPIRGSRAHRGAGKLAPENTLAALSIGHSHGYRMVEFDVKLVGRRRRVPAARRDAASARPTAGAAPTRCRGASSSRLDAGGWHSRPYAGEPLPTLAAVARWAARTACACNVEIKPDAGPRARDRRGGRARRGVAVERRRRAAAAVVVLRARARGRAGGGPRAAARAVCSDRLPADWRERCAAPRMRRARRQAHGADAPKIVEDAHARASRSLPGRSTIRRARPSSREWGVDTIITDAVDRLPPR